MLKLYNTLTRDKQEFRPVVPGQARLYVCGMTVYDYCHLGHARVMVVFDLVSRWLRESGLAVTYVRNITDIDDKIIKRAAENMEPIEALTARFIQAMNEDAAALGVLKPDFEPRATAYIPQMLDIIRLLEQKGLAYTAPDGDVNYSVRDFPGYGKLSGKSLEDLRAGERVEVTQAKRDPLDFVLWKHAKPGEPAWDSPWGPGRPGWHIECSAMASTLLGNHFDIHGGGQDLQFPHHENEIAQSEGSYAAGEDRPFVKYWMHNGFVRVDNEKMSKSLGNFFTVREILARYDAEVVRFFILRAQYRSPLNYSDHHLDDARNAYRGFYLTLREVPPELVEIDWGDPYAARFKLAMDDDFNTPEAVAILFELAGGVNRTRSAKLAGLLKALGGVLGILQSDPERYLQGKQVHDLRPESGHFGISGGGAIHVTGFSSEKVDQLIEDRIAARKAKNFAEADRIRKDLESMGVVLEDKPGGRTEWRRK